MKADDKAHKYRNNIVLSRQTDCGWYTFSRHLDTLLGKTTWQKSLETNQWFSLWWQMTIRIACWLLMMIFLNDRMVFFLFEGRNRRNHYCGLDFGLILSCIYLLTTSHYTPQKFWICDQINCLEKRFKICHILYLREPKDAFFIACYFIFSPNECPRLCHS